MSPDLQRELNLLEEMRGDLRRVDEHLVARCNTEQQAFRLCRKESRVHYTDAQLAELMEVSKGHLNTMLNADQNKRNRHMGRTLQNRLQRICQNTAIDQWGHLELMGLLYSQRQNFDEDTQLIATPTELRARKPV